MAVAKIKTGKTKPVADEANKGLFLEECKRSPYDWVLGAFAWGKGELAGFDGPDTWQTEILLDIGRQLEEADGKGCIIRIARATGHGPGKSAVIAWLILWGLSTFEGANGVVTANTETQLQTKTWPELTKWYRLCKWLVGDMLDLRGETICSPVPELKDWRIDRVTWSEQNTEAFQGLHNLRKRILCLYDESSGIPDTIWGVTEGALTDEGTEIIWVAFGNPTRNTGAFKDCFTGTRAKRWNHKQIDTRTCKYTNKNLIKEWIEDYGVDSDFVKVRVRGMFPSLSARQFISVKDVDAAFGRPLTLQSYSFAAKIICVDPAWTGTDEFVIGLRQGLSFRILRIIPYNDNSIQIATLIANIQDLERADKVFVDYGGGGTGIISAGRTLNRSWQGVWFNEASSDPGCLNKRAEMWKLMRDWLKGGGSIPEDKDLYNELIGPETVARLDGKIQIESKESMKDRKLKSPNRADCLAISFAYPVYGANRQISQAQLIDTLGNNLLGSYADEMFDSINGIGSYL